MYSEYEKKFTNEFDRILKEAYVDPESEVEYPPVAISKGLTGSNLEFPICICTYGNFSFIQAPPKSRKTFLVSLFCTAYLSNNKNFIGNIKGHRDNQKLVHYDTEQGDYHAHRVFNRIYKMTNKSKDYLPFSLREYSSSKRLDFIDWHLQKRNDIGFVVIDGIADLLTDVNDIVESNELVQSLMRWTKLYNVHIMTIIHSNYNSIKPTGHLGSFLEKKAETQISVTVDEDSNNSIVKCMRSRGQPFDNFSFKIINGCPYVEEDLADEGDFFINL